MPSKSRRVKPQSIDLALQGGGSHGAFTWGVLDRLLEDQTLQIDGISGTSAGALNAAVLATGYAQGGATGAREALRAFWHDVGASGGCFGSLPAAANPWAAWMPSGGANLSGFNLDAHPLYAWFNQFTRAFSPYQFNPYDLNTLRELVQRHVQVSALHSGAMALFITATAVRTGQPRAFSGKELSVDALLASACLPQLFRAVEIDGEPYWDGGYSGNPALWPLIYNTSALDILLVKVNPLVRPERPDTPMEIADRVNEITFNAGLVGEMRAIAFVRKLIQQGLLGEGHYKDLRLHMCSDEEGLGSLNASSKLNTEPAFLEALHALGRAAAERWLVAHRADVGQRSSLDIEATFLAPREAGHQPPRTPRAR
jgi:NTE family protein